MHDLVNGMVCICVRVRSSVEFVYVVVRIFMCGFCCNWPLCFALIEFLAVLVLAKIKKK